MQLPLFYESSLPGEGELILSEENSRHISQVLRITAKEKIQLTDGRGSLVTASISKADKKKAAAVIRQVENVPQTFPTVTIVICPVKNLQRFEWFLGKAVEIGVGNIIPILSERTERAGLKKDRLEKIIISSMIQSRQVWKTQLGDNIRFEDFLQSHPDQNKFIAHCEDGEKIGLKKFDGSGTILIGPEGDFTPREISEAIKFGYQPVTLGTTRLRTETAGIVAAVLLKFLSGH